MVVLLKGKNKPFKGRSVMYKTRVHRRFFTLKHATKNTRKSQIHWSNTRGFIYKAWWAHTIEVKSPQ